MWSNNAKRISWSPKLRCPCDRSQWVHQQKDPLAKIVGSSTPKLSMAHSLVGRIHTSKHHQTLRGRKFPAFETENEFDHRPDPSWVQFGKRPSFTGIITKSCRTHAATNIFQKVLKGPAGWKAIQFGSFGRLSSFLGKNLQNIIKWQSKHVFFEAKKTFWTKGDNSNPAISVRSLWTCSPASCPNSSRSARPFWTDVYDGRTDTPSPWAMCQQFLIHPNKHDKSICHSNGRNPEGRRCHNQLWKNRGRPSVTVGKIMFSIPTWHLNPPSVAIDQIRSSFAWFSSQAPWHVIWLSLPSEPMDWLPICSAICKAFLARSWHALSICKWKN